MTTVEALISSAGALASPGVVLMLLAGVFVGYWVGVLPGLGGIVAMALLLPVTLGMPPFEALALLIGMYAVVSITGDLTAILVGVPGSPASAPLVLDGFALTKKGLATRSMSAAVLSSAIGAVFGALLLLAAIPVMRPLVLALGSPQIFMLTLLGLAMVASLSGKSVVKGIATAGLGLLLAAVGPVAGVPVIRYSFDQLYLLDGLQIIPLAIGLFAIPEITDLHRSRSSIARGEDASRGRADGAWSGWGEVVRGRWLILRCSGIGAVIGAIPGLGGAVASWMGYGHAAQTTKDGELFGNGSFDGVLGPGAANNSKEGGGLIPTVAFGVPGTAIMAVLLGAFIMLGIQPGPNMVSRNLDLTYFMVWVLVLANLLGAAVALTTLKQLGKITYIRGTLLVPFVVALVLIGAGAATGNVGDLVAVVAFGLLAWFMRVHGWPVVPLLLGFVLGERMESSLFLSIRIHGAGWLTDPIVIVLGVAILATVLAAYRASRRRRREGGGYDPSAHADRSAPAGLWSLTFAATLVVLPVIGIVVARDWPLQARLLPTSASVVALAAILLAVVLDLRRRWSAARTEATVPEGEGADEVEAPAAPRVGAPGAEPIGGETDVSRAATQPWDLALAGGFEEEDAAAEATTEPPGSVPAILLYIVGFAVAVWAVGMTIALGVFVAGYYRFSGKASWARSLFVAVIAVAVYFAVFELLLPVPAVRPWLL